jgi:predicted nucleic acid-binding protein
VRLAVVDASVALAWVFPDEEPSLAATRLLHAFRANRIRLLAPSLWAYEVGHALRNGVIRGRISEAEGREAFSVLLGLGLSLVDFAPLTDLAWELASRHGITVYDAAYVAVAQAYACPCYSLDKSLIEACAGSGMVRSLDDFAA